MQTTDLKGRAVVSLSNPEKIGQVNEVFRVTAYALASTLIQRVMRREEALVKADEVIQLGEGGIMVIPNAVGARLQAQPG